MMCWQGKIQIDNAYGWRFVWTWIISQNNKKNVWFFVTYEKPHLNICTLQKFYWLHVIPNSKSVLENHKKFTDVVRFFQFILSCIIMNVPFNFHLFKYIFLQVGPKNQLPNFHELLSQSDYFGKKTNSTGVIKQDWKHPNFEA